MPEVRTSVAPNAQRVTLTGPHLVPCDVLSIKSEITPETLDVYHYPGNGHDPQLHVHVRQGISGRSIYLREADALLIRDFLNLFYPASPAAGAG